MDQSHKRVCGIGDTGPWSPAEVLGQGDELVPLAGAHRRPERPPAAHRQPGGGPGARRPPGAFRRATVLERPRPSAARVSPDLARRNPRDRSRSQSWIQKSNSSQPHVCSPLPPTRVLHLSSAHAHTLCSGLSLCVCVCATSQSTCASVHGLCQDIAPLCKMNIVLGHFHG